MRAVGSTNRRQQTLGTTLFVVGLLMTLTLGALAIWGDFEASLFDISIRAESGLNSLRCPILITPHEQGQVSAAFRNTGERPVNRPVRARISDGFITLIREENVQLPLQPGEQKRHHWDISPADAVYDGWLILVRVSTLRQAPMPSQSNTCGVLVLNVPGVQGWAVVSVWLSVGLAALLGSGILWWRSGLMTAQQRPLVLAAGANAVVVLAVLVCGLTGQWLPGIVLLAVWVLLIVATVVQILQGN